MADSLPALLEAHREEIKLLLPTYLDLDRFIANAQTVARDSKLKGCSADSLFRCCLDAARRGWEVGGSSKHCAVAPFEMERGGVTAILLPQWQGRAFLWFKSGAIRKLKADVVYEGDTFAIESGDEDRIVHQPDYRAKRSPTWLNTLDNIVGAYAIAWLFSGERVHSFVSQSQLLRTIEFVKKKNKGKLGFGWTDWIPEQCRKTAVHRLQDFIQPPPEMTLEQREAWQRASEASTYDVETTSEPAPDDLPTPKSVEVVRDGDGAGRVEGSHAGSERVSTSRASSPDASATPRAGGAVQRSLLAETDVACTAQDKAQIRAFCDEHNIKDGVFSQALFDYAAVDDVLELKASQLPGLLAHLEKFA